MFSIIFHKLLYFYTDHYHGVTWLIFVRVKVMMLFHPQQKIIKFLCINSLIDFDAAIEASPPIMIFWPKYICKIVKICKIVTIYLQFIMIFWLRYLQTELLTM